MTLAELFTNLNSIDGFTGRVTYHSFPVGESPGLPFICFLETSTSNFKADGVVFLKRTSVDIELYTKTKDTTSEALIEAKLDECGIPWDKTEEYIESEKCFEIVYGIVI